jgi:hypothetical protein
MRVHTLEGIEIPSALPLNLKVNEAHGLDGIEMLAASTITRRSYMKSQYICGKNAKNKLR